MISGGLSFLNPLIALEPNAKVANVAPTAEMVLSALVQMVFLSPP